MLSRSGQVVYHRALARNFGLRESAGGWRAVGCRACGAPHEHAVAVAALLHALTTFASAPRRVSCTPGHFAAARAPFNSRASHCVPVRRTGLAHAAAGPSRARSPAAASVTLCDAAGGEAGAGAGDGRLDCVDVGDAAVHIGHGIDGLTLVRECGLLGLKLHWCHSLTRARARALPCDPVELLRFVFVFVIVSNFPPQFIITGRAARADVGRWLVARLQGRLAARCGVAPPRLRAGGEGGGDDGAPTMSAAAAAPAELGPVAVAAFAADVDAVIAEAVEGVARDIGAACTVRSFCGP